MGEVTNAYPIIQNKSGKELTNVCATLTASDEARVHPDKTACVSSLPNNYQVTLKLTTDTDVEQDASIRVDVTSQEGFTFSLTRSSCLDVGLPDLGMINIGVVEPIP
jgi:subtilase family serine protease